VACTISAHFTSPLVPVESPGIDGDSRRDGGGNLPTFRFHVGFSGGMEASHSRLQFCLLLLEVAQGRSTSVTSLSGTADPR
jgi:hypothetical protein